MQRYGIEVLSDIELLALFYVPVRARRRDDIRELLQRFGSLYGLLSAEESSSLRLKALVWRNMRS